MLSLGCLGPTEEGDEPEGFWVTIPLLDEWDSEEDEEEKGGRGSLIGMGVWRWCGWIPKLVRKGGSRRVWRNKNEVRLFLSFLEDSASLILSCLYCGCIWICRKTLPAIPRASPSPSRYFRNCDVRTLHNEETRIIAALRDPRFPPRSEK